jgi:hypothetical protein
MGESSDVQPLADTINATARNAMNGLRPERPELVSLCFEVWIVIFVSTVCDHP